MDKSGDVKQLARQYCREYAAAAEAVRKSASTSHLWELVRAAEKAVETAQAAQDAQRRPLA